MSRRDISPFLQSFRNFLAGRQLVTRHRFEDMIASRTQEPPNLPPGPSSKLFKNTYFQRSARYCLRDLQDIPLPDNKAQLESDQKENEIQNVEQSTAQCSPQSSTADEKSTSSKKSRTFQFPLPGKVHRWD